jgi:hypothetical protein
MAREWTPLMAPLSRFVPAPAAVYADLESRAAAGACLALGIAPRHRPESGAGVALGSRPELPEDAVPESPDFAG